MTALVDKEQWHTRGARMRARWAALAACTMAFLFAFVPSAWAVEAHPVQSSVAPDASGPCIANVLDFTGSVGETVFVNVQIGGKVVSSMLPHTLSSTDDGSAADMFALEFDSVDELAASLEAGVKVSVYADRARSSMVYEGSLWPVYAELSRDGSAVEKRLIGAHVGDSSFTAPESLLVAGQAYRRTGASEQSGASALTFSFEAFSPEGSVDGAIRYVDVKTGEALSTYTPIPGLVSGEAPRVVDIPEIIESDGKAYRTLSFFTQVEASNPGATVFTVSVVEATDGSAAQGRYMARINMVDAASGEVIASDAIFVEGEVAYSLPDTIYRAAGSSTATTAYNRAAGEPAVLELSAAKDGVTTGTRTIEVRYEQAGPGAFSGATFVLHDGTKRAGDPSRVIGTFEGAYPPETYTDAAGNEFTLVGATTDYGPAAGGVVDAYYLPKGYSGEQEPYSVTINYVDFATRETIDSETFTSSPDDLEDISFEPPAQFENGGATWLRLDGQDTIRHNYWSHIAQYTVYYRDRSKPLESIPTITQVRVVYRDGGVTYVDGGVIYRGANGYGASGATGADGANARLDAGSEYNVAQGDGVSQQAIGQDGNDATQQRIDQDANPLASGAENGAPNIALLVAGILGGAVGLALLIALILFLLKRRKRSDDRA